MEFGIRVLVIAMLAIIVLVVIIGLIAGWSSESKSFIEGFIDALKAFVPI